MNKALQTMIENMPEKTGRSLEEWKEVLKQHPFEKHSEAVNYLKQEHGVTHGFANTIVTLSKEEQPNEVDLIAYQYNGREALYPIYQDLIEYVSGLGDDVTITPKKTSVSIIRKHQFLLIKPATKTRIDLGFKLKDVPVSGRLENSGPFGSMCTHRVMLSSKQDIDNELKTWIRQAYEQSV